MALNDSSIDSSIFSQIVWQSMPADLLNSFTFLMTIAKAIGILFLVYIVFLIVQSVIRTRQALRIKSIERNVAEINHKLDSLLHKKPKEDKKS